MTTFVDTSGWFAAIVPSDPAHVAIKDWFDATSAPIITTDYVIDETLTLLAMRGERRRAIEFGLAMFDGKIANIHFLSPEQIHRAWILFQSACGRGWSFTDCTSKIVIDDVKIKTAVALDQHFRQFGIQIEP